MRPLWYHFEGQAWQRFLMLLFPNQLSCQGSCLKKVSAGLGMVFLNFPKITNTELLDLIALFIYLAAAGSKSNEDVCI